jgi:hypothetical protein
MQTNQTSSITATAPKTAAKSNRKPFPWEPETTVDPNKLQLLFQKPGTELRTHGIAQNAVLFRGAEKIAFGAEAVALFRGGNSI